MSRDLPQSQLDLAALVGSRICHDLISPIGAIGNGVELLSMSGTAGGEELALISESVQTANARVRFLRIAYGLASEGQTIGRTEITGLLAEVWRAGRVRVHWAAPGDCLRLEVKLAFLALQCLENALPYGGTIEVTRTGQSWHLTARAEKMRADPALWDGLAGRAPLEVAGNTVHFALIGITASAAGRKLSVQRGEGSLTLAF